MSSWGRKITRKERAEATAEYLAAPHPPIELDPGLYLTCRCAEFDCQPHRAHFHELAEFNRQLAAQKKKPGSERPADERKVLSVFGF
jgi:hypothetical protein